MTMGNKWYTNGDLWFVIGLLTYIVGIWILWSLYWEIVFNQ